jgi:hypothetical protein
MLQKTSIPIGRVRMSKVNKATQNRANLLGINVKELQNRNAESARRPATAENIERMMYERERQRLEEMDKRAMEVANQMYEQAKKNGRPYFDNKQQNFTTSETNAQAKQHLEALYNQRLLNSSIPNLYLREYPAAIKAKMVNLFKRSVFGALTLPFTFAARAGHVMVVEPIVIVVTDVYGVVKRVYAYIFFIIMIFGVRHFYIHYARDSPYIEYAVGFIEESFPLFIAPTRYMVDKVAFFISGAFQQMRSNAGGVKNFLFGKAVNAAQVVQQQAKQQAMGGAKAAAQAIGKQVVDGAYDMGQFAFCKSVGKFAPMALGCSA